MTRMNDTDRLDFLQTLSDGYGMGWILRRSITGRGWRLHETSDKRAVPSVRTAIDNCHREMIEKWRANDTASK